MQMVHREPRRVASAEHYDGKGAAGLPFGNEMDLVAAEIDATAGRREAEARCKQAAEVDK